MSWFKSDADKWKQTIEAVANKTGRNPQMVEKDTIQSMFLGLLSEKDFPFVFKGGTSLSKAYNIIDRFSEDIDLSTSEKPSDSRRKAAYTDILSAGNELGLRLSNSDEVMSRLSYNKYLFEYESLFSNNPLEMMVETSLFKEVYPAPVCNVGSYIGKFCDESGAVLPIDFNSSSISMPVQSIERTFVDKVFAVCDYMIRDMQDRDSRHLYDIAKIMPLISMDDSLKQLVDKVRLDRMLSKNNPSAQPEHDITAMLKDMIKSRFYERDYKDITSKLLYEDYPYEKAIDNGIRLLAETDIFKLRTENNLTSSQENALHIFGDGKNKSNLPNIIPKQSDN